jgi:BMFP domain-containing protein YqiC
MLKSKFFNDFSNVAQGAFSTINAIREELDVLVKSRLERLLVSKGLVTKEENDVVLMQIKDLNMKINGLEAKIDNHAKQIISLKNKNK